MPNLFAYVALFSWPLVAILLFRSLPRSEAVAWTIVGGYLALPFGVGINPPVLPTIDKTLIPAVSAGILVLLGAGLPERAALRPMATGAVAQQASRRAGGAFTRQTRLLAPRSGDQAGPTRPGPVPRLVLVLGGLLIVTQFVTVATNGDPYVVGTGTLPGLRLYDALSMLQNNLVMVLPFILGLFFLGAPERQPILLRIFVLAGLIYSLPTLFEIRMSPQLSRWTYGFLAQSFAQAARDGGFRPVVFLQHGLWLAIFLAMTTLAAFALWRHQRGAGQGGRALAAGLWLAGVLALCHSLGSLVILALVAPLVLFLPVRGQMLMAFCITLAMLTYPMLRGAGLVPVQSLSDWAQSVSAERGQSLDFRLKNEDQLLAHANQRPWAGWGGFARSRVFVQAWDGSMQDISVTDGMWIIMMGVSGWLGYVATFGLLGAPVLLLFLRRRRLAPDLATAGLCLMLAANLIDMIPNATMTPLTWLIAGALAGRCRFVPDVVTAEPGPPARAPGFVRGRTSFTRPPQGRPARSGSTLRIRLTGALVMLGLAMGPVAGRAVAQEVPAGLGLTNPSLAFGLTGIADWSTEMPFLDLMKTARPWIGHQGNTWGAMKYEDLVAGGWLDAQGWPKAIPPGLTSVGTIWTWDAKDLGAAATRAGTYVLTYRGQGSLQLKGDAKVLQSRSGRIQFQNVRGGQVMLNITATDPQQSGDHIRDIVIVPQKYAALQAMGEVFNPDWLALIADARELRFMDWMRTNGTIGASWDSRPQVSDASWMAHGVPLEIMVQLANQTGAEPWFNMPAGADEAYIRAFASYVRDHLNPRLKVHVEYSNETWNWMFPQTHWMLSQAQTVWGSTDKAAYIDYNAMVATKCALIWSDVFGPQAKDRLDRVLGVQTVNTWGAKRLLTAPIWQQIDPKGYVAPSTVFNSLAVTTYFGVSTIAKPELRDGLLARIKANPAAAAVWLAQRLNDPDYSQSIPQITAAWAAQKALAAQYGLKLVAYEGGQHVLHSAGVQGLNPDDLTLLTAFLSDFVRSPAMADLYQQLWTAWAKVGDGPFMQFTDVDQASKYGAWGLYSALGDHNPRADLLMDLNARTPAWFSSGGPQYQQGAIHIAGYQGEVLTGTDRDDWLIGGAGDDSFHPGLGQDAIAGGGGTDTVFLPGKPADYRLGPADAEGLRHLTGPGLDDRLKDIARFGFDGGGTVGADQMPAD
ncbi:hypothetical protein GC209_19725 [bacterium]|nr:hypothetical protein [bacterium]